MSLQFASAGNSELAGRPASEILRMSRSWSDDEISSRPKASLIAIVDDDPWVRKSLERLIKSEGFRTESFASAEDFIKAGDHEETYCIILDLRLPGMSGLELQRYLATKHDSIPIIFVSAHDEPETRDEAMQAGAIGFFSKPFNDEALVEAVRSVTSRS
jgi:FixJ family two-component response regulator